MNKALVVHLSFSWTSKNGCVCENATYEKEHKVVFVLIFINGSLVIQMKAIQTLQLDEHYDIQYTLSNCIATWVTWPFHDQSNRMQILEHWFSKSTVSNNQHQIPTISYIIWFQNWLLESNAHFYHIQLFLLAQNPKFKMRFISSLIFNTTTHILFPQLVYPMSWPSCCCTFTNFVSKSMNKTTKLSHQSKACTFIQSQFSFLFSTPRFTGSIDNP
jgi:hypothetical protein